MRSAVVCSSADVIIFGTSSEDKIQLSYRSLQFYIRRRGLSLVVQIGNSSAFRSKIQSFVKPSNADFPFIKEIKRLGKIHFKHCRSRIRAVIQNQLIGRDLI